MTNETLKFATYPQNCSMAGRVAYGATEATDDGYDWHEGTREELLAYAEHLELHAKNAGAGKDLFMIRTAKSIREMIA